MIAAGAATALARPRGGRVAALAVCAYLAYVIRVGGDFMSGRFLTAPFVVSLCLLGRWRAESATARLAPIAIVGALGLAVPIPTVMSGAAYHTPWEEIRSPSGITDERGFYFQHTGWLTPGGMRTEPVEAHELPPKLARVKADNPRVFLHDTVGMAGYYTGPDRQIIDVFALCDPLLARLPAHVPWRIGHYERDVPEGYVESVDSGRNVIADPHIASLYAVVREVTRGPIWSLRRWRAIVALNTGHTDGWPVSR